MPKLTARTVETLKAPGRHSDGDNLYLSITASGAKSWTFFYRFEGKRKEMGLGSASPGQVSLSDARKKALEARRLLNSGFDPLAAKRQARAGEIQIPTFGEFADQYLNDHRSKFRNAKHIAQWEMTLAKYCAPIRSRNVADVDTEAVLKVLRPIWSEIPETAARLRGRIENILDAARARGFCAGENPARWRGHLKSLLPARQRLARGHHPALPYADLPRFVQELRERQSEAALALEFCILTASRSGEVLGAKWQEVDLQKQVWTIPAERMKAGHEHRIPLSARALEILEALRRGDLDDPVFTGERWGAPLSIMAMTMLLRRMGRSKPTADRKTKGDSVTVHGFRSTFRDWASEQTSFPNETCEHALAHRISDKAEAAYRRGDQFEKRRKLMEAWAQYAVSAERSNIVLLSKTALA